MSYFTAKMHQIRFRWGSLQHSPDPLAEFKGPTSRGGEETDWKWTGGEGRGLCRGREGTEGDGGRGRQWREDGRTCWACGPSSTSKLPIHAWTSGLHLTQASLRPPETESFKTPHSISISSVQPFLHCSPS